MNRIALDAVTAYARLVLIEAERAESKYGDDLPDEFWYRLHDTADDLHGVTKKMVDGEHARMTEAEALRALLDYLTVPGKVIRFAHAEPMVRFIMGDVTGFARCMTESGGDVLRAARLLRDGSKERVEAMANAANCTCFYDCGKDSHTGRWHQHEEDPCPVHPDAEMVG